MYVQHIIYYVHNIYRLRQDMKAASEVSYNPYSSEASTYSKSGDHRLAQSAQLYHYQHQKQKILEMERYFIG